MLRAPGVGTIAKLILAIIGDTSGIERSLDNVEDKVKSFAGKLEERIDTTTFLAVGAAVTGIGLAVGGVLTMTGLYAAKIEVLGTSLRVVGETAGYSMAYLEEQEEKIKALGITTESARKIMMLLIQSEIDLTEATDLCRTAQDLAVLSGENSSDTAVNLATAIATGNPMLLRRYGIMRNLSDIQGKYGKDMTEVEKKEAILNMIREEGIKVSGVYVTAMEDVGKQLTSLPRYIDEFKLAFGEAFIPVIGLGVQALTKLIQLYLDLPTGIKTGITYLMTFIAALGLIVGPILTLIGFLPQIAAGWALIVQWSAPVIAALTGIGAAIAAGISTPVLIAIAVIIALIGVIFLWVKYGEAARTKTREIWGAIGKFLRDTFNRIRQSSIIIWRSIADFFSNVWNKILTAARNFKNDFLRILNYVSEGVRDRVNAIIGFIDFGRVWSSIIGGLTNFKNSFIKVWENIKQTVKNQMNAIINMINTLLSKVQYGINSMIWQINSLGGGIFNINIPSIYLGSIPGLQRGGRIMEAGFVDVGERGRERVFLPKGAEVRPLGKGATTTPAIHIHLEYNEELTSKTFARLLSQYTGGINK